MDTNMDSAPFRTSNVASLKIITKSYMIPVRCGLKSVPIKMADGARIVNNIPIQRTKTLSLVSPCAINQLRITVFVILLPRTKHNFLEVNSMSCHQRKPLESCWVRRRPWSLQKCRLGPIHEP